jgi:hypothetical protein
MQKTITLNKDIIRIDQSKAFSKIYYAIWSIVLLLTFSFAGCKKDNFVAIQGVCPLVVTDPMNGAVDVALNKVISATFNTAIKASTVNNSTFTITQGSTAIAGTIGPATNGNVFTFTPTAALLPFTVYTGTITTGVKDTLGSSLVNSYVFTFTTIPQVTLTSNLPTSGTTTGAGTFAQGSVVTVTATPNAGFTFTNWTKAGVIVSTSASYQFTLAGNTALVANFTAVPIGQFAIVLSSNPAAGGTTTGSGSFNAGTTVTVTAFPNAGYTFVNFTEGATIVSTSPGYQFIATANRTLVANFKLLTGSQFALVLSSSPAAGGSTTGSGAYNAGTSVTATATPNVNFSFVNWTENGVIASTSAAYTFVLNANRTLVANFASKTPAPNLGANLSLFASFGGNAGITNQGINTVINNGAIGTTAASTLITGFHDGLTADVYTETPLNKGLVTLGIYTAPPPPGTAAKFAIATQALAEANALYIAISPANKPGGTDPGAGELGGLTLAPGIYKSAGATFNISTGDLTLDAQGDPNAVWIFQTAAGLTVGIAGNPRNVIMKNGALAKNVFWYVGSAATINAAGGGTMVGTIISTAGVTFSTAGNAVQTVLNGRAISLVASVTMVNTTINVP